MNDWMNNPAMKNIDPIKLELIKTAASKTSGKIRKRVGSYYDGSHQRS